MIFRGCQYLLDLLLLFRLGRQRFTVVVPVRSVELGPEHEVGNLRVLYLYRAMSVCLLLKDRLLRVVCWDVGLQNAWGPRKWFVSFGARIFAHLWLDNLGCLHLLGRTYASSSPLERELEPCAWRVFLKLLQRTQVATAYSFELCLLDRRALHTVVAFTCQWVPNEAARVLSGLVRRVLLNKFIEAVKLIEIVGKPMSPHLHIEGTLTSFCTFKSWLIASASVLLVGLSYACGSVCGRGGKVIKCRPYIVGRVGLYFV